MIVRVWLFLSFFFACKFVQANSAERVLNSFGQVSFEVVYTSNKNETDLPLGIHAIEKRGGSHLAVAGSVLGVNRGFNGILAISSVSSPNTEPATAMAVVDGEFTIFNRNNYANKADKAPLILGKKGFTLYDPILGREIQARPQIDSIDNIRIFYTIPTTQPTNKVPYGSQIYFVSIKSPHTFGTGFTFAFIAPPAATPAGLPMILDGQASLLSYDFFNSGEQLQLLWAGRDNYTTRLLPYGAYSPNLLTSLLQKYKSQESNPLMSLWIKHLEKFHTHLSTKPNRKNPKQEMSNKSATPYYDLESRRVVFPQFPALNLSVPRHLSTNLYQFFDPTKDSWFVVDYSNSSKETNALTFLNPTEIPSRLPGQVVLDSDNKYKITSLDPKYQGHGLGEYLITVRTEGQQDSAYFLLKAKTSSEVKTLNVSGIDLVNFTKIESVHLSKERAFKDGAFHYVLLSILRKAGRKQFVVLGVNEDMNGNLKMAYIKNHDGIYLSREELLLRAEFFELQNRDDITGLYIDLEKPFDGVAAYREKLRRSKNTQDQSYYVEELSINNPSNPNLEERRRFVPYSFFPMRTDGNVADRKAYLRVAKTATALQNGVLSYLQFADPTAEKADEHTSGFYVNYLTLQGKIQDETGNLEIPFFKIKDSQRIPSADTLKFIPGGVLYYNPSRPSAMALDAVSASPQISIVPFSKKVKPVPHAPKFHIALIASSDITYERGIEPRVATFDIPLPFESLMAVKIIRGKRNRSDDFYALFFFGKEGSAHTGVYAISGQARRISKNGQDIFEMNVTQQGAFLTREPVSPSELSLRMKATAEGNFYWIDNPEAENNSPKLRVRDLLKPDKLIYVNRDEVDGSRLQLRFDEPLESMGGSMDLYNQWQILSRYELKRRFSWFQQYIADLEKKLKEDEKKNRRAQVEDEDLLDGFGGYALPKESFADADKKWLRLHEGVGPQFRSFLEQLATPQDPSTKVKRQVLLVEDKMKQIFLNDMMALLWQEKRPFSISLSPSGGREFQLFAYDTASTIDEGQKEFISMQTARVRSPILLFSTLDEINEAGSFVKERANSFAGGAVDSKTKETTSEEDDALAATTGGDSNKDEDAKREEPVADATDESEFNTENSLSRWLFLATEGRQYDTAKLRKKLASIQAQVPMLIIGTPEEYERAKRENPEAVAMGVFDQFEVNNQFLTSSWMQWPIGSKFASDKTKQFSQQIVSEEEFQVFPDIDRMFSRAARGEAEGEQVVLIVPKELKPLINKLIMSRWAALNPAKGEAAAWHNTNPNLLLYSLNGDRKENSQAKVFENFQAMRGGASYRNVVFFGDLEAVQQIGRPFNEDKRDFKLSDPLAGAEGLKDGALNLTSLSDEPIERLQDLLTKKELLEKQQISIMEQLGAKHSANQQFQTNAANLEAIEARIAELSAAEGARDAKSLPHLLWLIAAEGTRVQPKANRQWNLKSAVDRKVSTILIGTPEELGMIEQEMGFEANFFNPREHFKIVHLNSPSDSVKTGLVRSLFRRAEIQSLDYRFSIGSLSGEEAERQLVAHFVNRVEQIAIQQNVESTSAFIRAFTELRRTLVEDTGLRRNRLIDKNFLERLFVKIFPLPINMDNLEPEDPLNRLADITEAARRLQHLGYHGAMDLKERTLDTILNQTRSGDAGRPIPNSQIYYGGTSSGKTFLFKKIVELLGLTPYSPTKSNNEKADYIIISVQNLVDGAKTDATKTTVDEAIEMVQDLLAQPKGHRAFILFDDAHKTGSKEVHQKLFAFIQSLFEAPNGLIRVKKRGTKDFKEVPVQNLNLYMTVNPTANKQQMDKYADEDRKDVKRMVLAALATHNIDMEESILARWSDIINLDQFPRGAKVPALVERVRALSSNGSSTVLVDSSAIGSLVERYPDANAREFLAPAATALTRIPTYAESSSLYIVTARNESKHRSTVSDSGVINSSELSSAVKELTQIDPIYLQDPSSSIKLMRFLMGNIRTQIFNQIVLAAQNSEDLRIRSVGQTTVLQRNFMAAVAAHLLKNPTIPVSEVRIPKGDFSYMSTSQLVELVELQTANNPPSYFPLDVGVRENITDFLSNAFLDGVSPLIGKNRTRQDVMQEAIVSIEEVLKKILKLYMRQASDKHIRYALNWSNQDIVDWYEALPSEDPKSEYKQQIQVLVHIFKKFSNDFYDESLKEIQEGTAQDLNYYDMARIFSYLIDKALTHMPWGVLNKFTIDIMGQASDLSLGQKPSFINYVQKNEISPLAIVTSDFLSETFTTNLGGEERWGRLENEFKNKCQRSLTTKRGEE